MDMSQYRELFVSESRGHLNTFNDLIVQLESNAGDQGIIAELFRHAHSLKGMAATMQFQPIAELAHKMEDLLSKVRSGELTILPALADLLLEGSDTLGNMITTIETGDEQLPDISGLANRLAGYTPAQPTLPRVSAIPGTSEQTPESREPDSSSQYQSRQSDTFKSVRVKTEILDRLVNITGELITTRYRLTEQAKHCPETKLEESLGQLSLLLRELRDEVFQARMLPFSLVAERFPRLVRDLARKQNKEIAFQIEGREIELDRGILEEISEPLIHILRNAVDHGLETPDERIASGKSPAGRISIAVQRDKDYAIITIADDGRGMEPGLLVAKAIEKGLINTQEAEAMTPQEAVMLVCTPGFSTAKSVSDISGRGVGMDAVRSAVHNLGGTLAIDTETGRGSSFILKLPISVSIINALLVECGNLTLAFPLNAIDRALELRREDIFEENGQKVCTMDFGTVPLKSLNRLLGQPMPKGGASCIPAIVTATHGALAGLVTDRILGQQEIFVKPLGSPLSRIRTITGATMLGDGRIVYVMDISMIA